MYTKTPYVARSIGLLLLALYLTACTAANPPAATGPLTWQQQKDALLSKARELDPEAYLSVFAVRSTLPVSPSYPTSFSMGVTLSTPSGKEFDLAYDTENMADSLKLLREYTAASSSDAARIQRIKDAFERTKLGPAEILAIVNEKGVAFAEKHDLGLSAQMNLSLENSGSTTHKPPFWVFMVPIPEEALFIFVDAENGTILEEKTLQ